MASPQSAPSRDQECAFLARDLLFPLKIQRDGSHPTLFPAAEALARLREVVWQGNGGPSSAFFPRGVLTVHDVTTGELKWNGQPDMSKSTTPATVPLIPHLLSVRACVCGGSSHDDKEEAYVVRKQGNEREIILCRDKLIKKQSTTSVQSRVAVETALARQLTLVAQEFLHHTNDDCAARAMAQVQAARAAECYYSAVRQAKQAEVKRGPALGHVGFSLYPASVRQMLQNRCLRAVAARYTVCETNREAQQCIQDAMSQ